MKKIDLAESMESVLASEEHKDIFASAEKLQKLAFKKEAQDATADETKKKEQSQYKCVGCADYYIKDIAGVCQCKPGDIQACAKGCGCHTYPPKTGLEFWQTQSSVDAADELVVIASDSLLKASEELEGAGLPELAAQSLYLLDQLIVEAKKRKAKKSKKSPAKSTGKSTEKSTGKSTKKTEKDSKKSEKDSKKST